MSHFLPYFGRLRMSKIVDSTVQAWVNGEIHVRRVVLEVSKKITGADKVWTIRDYPKNDEHRTIRIGDQLCQDIREYLMATGSAATTCSSPRARARPSRATSSVPGSGRRRSSAPDCASACASTTYAARTPPGC